MRGTPRSTRPSVAVAHDYLTQRGGAERVVLTLVRAFPGAPLHTTLYDPEATYPDFAGVDVRTSPLNRVAALRRDHRLALPLLAPASSRMRIDADVVVASSSGWAHGFDTDARTIVYCHNPARWLYQTDEYLGGAAWRSPVGPPLLALRPFLRRWDRTRADRVDVYLANSRVVQRRIRATYGRDAELLPPPHGMDASARLEAVPDLEDWEPGYALVVSRLLPYKNVDAVIEAVRGTSRRLVVVGRGPEEARLRATLPDNVRLLGGLSDAQLLRGAGGGPARRRLPRDRGRGRDRAVLRPAGARPDRDGPRHFRPPRLGSCETAGAGRGVRRGPLHRPDPHHRAGGRRHRRVRARAGGLTCAPKASAGR